MNAGREQKFNVVVSVLIAVVTIMGALTAWRVSLLNLAVGDAQFNAMVAVINREDALTVGTARGYGRYRAFLDYTTAKAVLDTLDEAEREAYPDVVRQSEDEIVMARDIINTLYLTQDGEYEIERDIQQVLADARREQDVDPTPFFAEAEQARGRVRGLSINFIVLSLALLNFTVAQSLHRDRWLLRWVFAVVGGVLLVGASGYLAWSEVPGVAGGVF